MPELLRRLEVDLRLPDLDLGLLGLRCMAVEMLTYFTAVEARRWVDLERVFDVPRDVFFSVLNLSGFVRLSSRF